MIISNSLFFARIQQLWMLEGLLKLPPALRPKPVYAPMTPSTHLWLLLLYVLVRPVVEDDEDKYLTESQDQCTVWSNRHYCTLMVYLRTSEILDLDTTY